MNPVKQPSPADAMRREADRIVDEFPEETLEVLATNLETEASDTYDDAAFDTALAIVAELRRRAASGVRKWRGPRRDT
jgi:hypothetical protein